jgi:hypothetical protein
MVEEKSKGPLLTSEVNALPYFLYGATNIQCTTKSFSENKKNNIFTFN